MNSGLNDKIIHIIHEELDKRDGRIEQNIKQLNEEFKQALEQQDARILEIIDSYRQVVEELTTYVQRIVSINKSLQNNQDAVRECLEKIKENEGNIQKNSERIDAVSKRISGLENIEINLRNNNARIESVVKRINDLDNMEINLRNNNAQIESVVKRISDLDNMEINLRNNNAELENIISKIENLETKFSIIKKRIDNPITVSQEGTVQKEQTTIALDRRNITYSIDYFDFENTFRGSRAQIKKIQEQYISYYEGCSHVVDLGSGRGEFLELLKENSIDAVGVEVYDEFVELCRKKGLDVIQQDALEYLRQQEEVDGIFAGQLIEHIPLESIIELCTLAYEKLKLGGYMILETPNPMSLAIFTHSFYMDPSHLKPVHPLTLKYIVEKAGFKDVEILFTENSRYPVKIPDLNVKGADNLDDFNKSMRVVEDTLFGSQDYAIIAKR